MKEINGAPRNIAMSLTIEREREREREGGKEREIGRQREEAETETECRRGSYDTGQGLFWLVVISRYGRGAEAQH